MEPSALPPASLASPGVPAPGGGALPDEPSAASAGSMDVLEPAPPRPAAHDPGWERTIGLVLAGLVMLIFLVSNPVRHNFYEHFTWQAAAWLEGQAGIRYPVCPPDGVPTFSFVECVWTADPGEPTNDYFLDVLPLTNPDGHLSGRALIPFPPLPAIILTPLVAIWGVATDAQTFAAILGGLDVWLAWWLLGALRPGLRIRVVATLFFGLGTVFWYTSMLGTTWYFAHVVAVGLTLTAVGIALRGDRAAVDQARIAVEADWEPRPAHGAAGFTGSGDAGEATDSSGAAGSSAPTGRGGLRAGVADLVAELGSAVRHGPWTIVDRRQFLAGLVLGLACTARLTVVFGLPFLAFAGSGGTPLRRAVSAGLGTAIPVLALVAYNVATTGHVFHPAYDYLYQQEANGYPQLGYNPSWSIEDIRYIPQNIALMLGGAPSIMPDCSPGDPRSLFSATCPFIVPRTVGMSVLLTSPAYLLAIPTLLRMLRSRLVAGAALAVALIAVANLMHFSQGWVQFGYRFSNDFVPFALVLVALGMIRFGQVRGWVGVLVGASILINAWGVAWGVILGW